MKLLSRFFILVAGVLFAACATPPGSPTISSPAGSPAATEQASQPTAAPTRVLPTAAIATVASATAAVAAPTDVPTAATITGSTTVAPSLQRTLSLQQPSLQGDDVKTLQQRLLELGYRQLGSADGLFGANTAAAVRAFQTLNQLDVDGVVGPNTWTRLYASEAQRFDLHAIVDTQRNYFLGASNGANWIAPAVAATLVRDTQYQLLDQTGDHQEATGTLPELPNTPPCEDTASVDFREQVPANRPIGITAGLNTLPRPVTEVPTATAALQAPIGAALRTLGLDNPRVQITRALRADVDGNGSEETFLASTYRASGADGPQPTAKAGDYSALLVLSSGANVASVIASDVITRDIEFGAPLEFELLGLWDMNGDGALEIAATSDYYEGASTSIYTFDGTVTKEVLMAGCGV